MEKNESNLPIRLLIKGKGFEISTEGKTADLYKELDTLANFANAVSSKLGTRIETRQNGGVETSNEQTDLNVAEMPLITPSKNELENIRLLFETPWGKTPRTNAEITKALEVNAVPAASKHVAIYLARLIKRGCLRRIEKDGKYHYFKVPQQASLKDN